jgi:Ser/Thr protein kinase RdoA (MazF antagonist)
MSLLQHAPRFDPKAAVELAAELYGLSCVAKPLPSERDQNFLLTTAANEKYILKIANALETRSLLEAQNAVLEHLAARVTFTPRLIKAKSGAPIEKVQTGKVSHQIRLISYIDGQPLASAKHSAKLLFDLGKKIGRLTQSLVDFDHVALHRQFHWDLASGLSVLHQHSTLLSDEVALQIDEFAERFERSVGSRLTRLPRSIIHADANDYNVIVKGNEVVGLIDFGDMVHSYRVGELSIAMAYLVLDQADPLVVAKQVVNGYLDEWQLNSDEFECLWWFVLLRLCMSVCLAAYQQRQEPENEYLDISQSAIQRSLPGLLAIEPGKAIEVLSAIN